MKPSPSDCSWIQEGGAINSFRDRRDEGLCERRPSPILALDWRRAPPELEYRSVRRRELGHACFPSTVAAAFVLCGLTRKPGSAANPDLGPNRKAGPPFPFLESDQKVRRKTAEYRCPRAVGVMGSGLVGYWIAPPDSLRGPRMS